ncbi:hypothetical protein SY83_09165 [Paenibacillus swuensis]|uniref:AraC family transcriptional regulator n=1 Tax=Paenibacillus swuensis TaxID=1178515 RepID=A0A172THT2_9BACL|nr:response regulator [Paenibacillus swuensis]ANE46417.1 hypothetical protein SY83_09165 [Paenibacillus swuensis]
MAYRVMLVDDERVDLEWLKRRMPWEELGLTISATANSAFTALRFIEENPVDILISDIKMPIMSGLELAQKARQFVPNMKVVFISGHEDFDYAKQAISLNAVGYVLKPVENQELHDILKTVVYQLDQEHITVHEQQQLSRTLPFVRNELIHQWLEGYTSSAFSVSELEKLGIHMRPDGLLVSILEVDDMDWKLMHYPKEKQQELLHQAIRLITESFDYYHLGYYFKSSHHRITLITEHLQAHTILMETIDLIRKNTPLTITVGLGPRVYRLEPLTDSYQLAKKALDYKLFVGKSCVIPYHEAKKEQHVQTALNLEEKLEPLMDAMREYDLVKIDDGLEELFAFVNHMDSKISVYNFVMHLVAKLDAQFRKMNESVYEILQWDYDQFEVLYQFETVHDMKSWLRRRLFELSELLLKKHQGRDRKIIHAVKAYIDLHIESKITLRNTAHQFAFSPNYLGFLFKEETGIHFSEYVMERRLEKACELLLDPSLKIYEITDRIGYKNMIYFNRHFKEQFGMTPSDYRKKHKV